LVDPVCLIVVSVVVACREKAFLVLGIAEALVIFLLVGLLFASSVRRRWCGS
jgi:F0F1-type ATP synthase membrane subunit c/vacuolar-type H+-ATPase subunit K